MKTLYKYLKENLLRTDPHGVIDHAIRADLRDEDVICFYIHPQDRDGETLDFVVEGNLLIPQGQAAEPEDALKKEWIDCARAELIRGQGIRLEDLDADVLSTMQLWAESLASSESNFYAEGYTPFDAVKEDISSV